MKNRFLIHFLFILTFLSSFLNVFSQQTLIKVNNWNAYVHVPSDYDQTSNQYPTIIFIPGLGEVGTDANKLIANGPGAYLKQGWDGTALGVKFIIISIQPPSAWPSVTEIKSRVEILKSQYRIGDLYMTGLSMGGWASMKYATTYPNDLKKIVTVEGVDIGYGLDLSVLWKGFATGGGKMVNFEQKNDYRVGDMAVAAMNQWSNGSAQYLVTNFGGGGHCCWSSFYGGGGAQPGVFNIMGVDQTLYDWLARDYISGVPQNKPPVADAGTDMTITLPVNTVKLTGNGTDADGSIVKYEWTKVSGPSSFTFTNATASSTDVNNLVEGVYEFQLKVTDDKGATGTATVKVTVKAAANEPPVANAGTDMTITLPVNTVKLTGNGSDTDGSIVKYEWTKVSGPSSFTFTNAAASSTDVNNLVEGVYEFQLKVTDDKGTTGTATVKVTVKAAANVPPVADAGADTTIQLPQNVVSLNGSKSSANGSPISAYEWVQVSGPSAATVKNPNSATTAVEDLKVGEYVFRLKVSDLLGLSSTADVAVTVKAAANPDDCGCDVVLPKHPSGGIYFINGTTNGITIKPGDKVCIKADTYSNIYLRGIVGTPDKPITIINCGGLVRVGDSPSWAISIANCRYFRLTGSGDPSIKYGIKVNWPGGFTSTGIGVGDSCTDYEIDHYEAQNVSNGFICKINPADCEPGTWGQNWTVRNISLHDNYIHNTVGEAFYIMNHAATVDVKDCSTGNTITVEPVGAVGVKIYNNIIDSAGWDGIQLVKAIDAEIYNNRVTNYGLEKRAGQDYGIILGGKSVGKVYNNFIANGSGPGLSMTGYNNNMAYNNVIANVGDKGITVDDRPMPDNKYVNFQIYLFNNTVVNADYDIRILNGFGTMAPGSKVYNNLLVAPRMPDEKYINSYLVINDPKLVDTASNVYYKNIADVGFVNPGALDFRLLPGSPAINAGRDLSQYGVIDDINGLSRPQGSAYDVGAYEYDEHTPPPNQKPVANAGADQSIRLPQNTVTVNGSGTDADGTIASYQWKVVSGPAGANIVNNNEASTEIDALQQGVYILELTVTDDKGDTGKDSVKITVAAGNVPPTANAGSDMVITLPSNSVSLSGSGNDADGGIASYKWDKISGPGQFSITAPGNANTTITNLVKGVYLFTLTVSDNEGAIAKDTVKVTVNEAPNQAPVANAGADVVITLPDNTAALSGSGTDADGNVASYLWTKVNGPSSFTITNPSSAATNVSGLVEGIYEFELKVTDDKGASATDRIKVTVNAAPNEVPVVDAGADQTITLPVNTVSLSGTGSDADGSIATYQWTKISGPSSFTIVNASSAATDVSGLVAGVYEFELKVTDDKGATATDVMKVIVNEEANKTPIANAGADQTITLPANTISLSGSGSDADGTIASYLWTKVSGPSAFTIVDAGVAKTDVTGLLEGVYEFELKVTDDKGAVATDRVKITVKAAPNKAPVANAGADQAITLPANTISLSGSGSDADGNIVAYQWTKVSGPSAFTIVNASSAATDVSGLVEGVYQFELKVTDDKGAVATDVMKVTVNAAPNKAPVANAGPDRTITLPANSTSLSGNGNDADGNIVSYQWTKMSGPSAFTIVNPSAAVTDVTGLVEGIYEFRLTVTDDKGATATDVMKVTVNAAPNKAPTANAGSDKTITLPVNTISLSGSGSDPDGKIVSYQWSGKSGPATYSIVNPSSAVTDVTGLAEGVYEFELKVTDDKGATATDVMKVTVNAVPNKAPVANAGPDRTITLPVNTTSLSGSGSDPDGKIVSYQWTKMSGPSAFSIVNAGSPVTDVSGLVEGVYEFQLKVTDDKGATATDVMKITVNAAPNKVPTANAGPDRTITLPANTTSLSGSGSDPDGKIVSYQWTKVSGPTAFSIVNAGSPVTDVSGLTTGVYEFQLKVTDDRGATATDIMKVTVNAAPNKAPTANAGSDRTITLPVNSTTLSGSGADPDGKIVSYQWTKSSGPANYSIVNATSPVTDVSGLVAGIYQFQLKVTDDKGATATDVVKVTVLSPSNLPPTANAGQDISVTFPVNSFTLNGSGSDPDGTIVGYSWMQVSGPSSSQILNSKNASTEVSNLVAGTYLFELTVTDNNGATGVDTMQLTVSLQRESLIGSSVRVYPNPTPDIAVLEVAGAKGDEHLVMIVTDANGRIIQKKELFTDGNVIYKEQIDLTRYAKGAYFVSLMINGQVRVTKEIIKIR